MAATITLQDTIGEVPSAPTFVARIRVQGDASYPQATGGYPLGLDTLLPGKTILGVTMSVVADLTPSDIGCVYDRANDKLKCFVISTGTEVADTASAAALDVELLVFAE